MRKSRSPSIWTSLISDMPVLLHFDNSLSEVSVFAIQHSPLLELYAYNHLFINLFPASRFGKQGFHSLKIDKPSISVPIYYKKNVRPLSSGLG